MQCALCNLGQLLEGTTTMTFEKGDAVVVVRDVPALVCENCGDAFVKDEIARKTLESVQKELARGVQVEILRFAA